MNQIQMRHQSWMRMALLNFLLATLMGALLRLAFVTEIPWIKYKFLMHGHSHVAMLGWIYLGLIILFMNSFLDNEQQKKKVYKYLIYLTQVTVIGMLISFPLQGYAVFSITFSTLHVFLSYAFTRVFYFDLKRKGPLTFSGSLAVTALGLMILSTMGLWAMPLIMMSEMKGSMLYYMAVQFFLHFQFNGWFLFALLALLFKFLEKKQIAFSSQNANRFYQLLLTSSFLTFALALAWSNPQKAIFWVNSLGVAIQLIAVIWMLKLMHPIRIDLEAKMNKINYYLLKLAFLAFVLKVIVQAAVVVPYIATIAYTIRNYVIGFIHLLLLGIISLGLFAFASQWGLLNASAKSSKLGGAFFLSGLFLSEAILFLQGTLFWASKGFLPAYYELLFGASLLMPLGLLLLFLAQWRRA